MNFAGRLAADTLGFISGDVPGAFAADRIYQRYTKNKLNKKNKNKMPKRKATNLGTQKGVQPKRRRQGAGKKGATVSAGGSRRRSVVGRSVSGVSSVNSGNSARVAAVGKKGGSVAREGRKKVVKVPKKLRSQIQKALTPYLGTGTFMEIHSERFALNALGQELRSAGYQSLGLKQLFDPCWVLNAASILWNGKTPGLNPGLSGNNFEDATLKVNVLNQSSTFRFKNNTGRTMNINIYVVSPKSILPDAQNDPAFFWIDSMKNEEGSGASAVDQRRNIGLASPNTLYATPYMSKMFMQKYGVDCVKVVLEAGKEFTHKVTGPNMMYDFSKYQNAQGAGATTPAFQNQQKFIKAVFFTSYYDLVGTTTGNCSRSVNMYSGTEGTTNSYGLLVETTNYMKLACPDLVGFRTGAAFAANSHQQLNNRKVNPYYLKDWSNTGPVGAVGYINDNTPNQPATGGF